jgi:hypothetical protein
MCCRWCCNFPNLVKTYNFIITFNSVWLVKFDANETYFTLKQNNADRSQIPAKRTNTYLPPDSRLQTPTKRRPHQTPSQSHLNFLPSQSPTSDLNSIFSASHERRTCAVKRDGHQLLYTAFKISWNLPKPQNGGFLLRNSVIVADTPANLDRTSRRESAYRKSPLKRHSFSVAKNSVYE